METVQLLTTIVLSITTLLLVVVGVQIVLVLRQIRQVLEKANHMLSGFERVGTGLDNGLAEIAGFLNGFRTIYKVIETILPKKHEA